MQSLTAPTTAKQAHEAVEAAAKQATQEVRHLATMAVGHWCRQGDVYLIHIDGLPPGFTKPAGLQLAPGTTQGSRHVLAMRSGVAPKVVVRDDARSISDAFRSWLAQQPAIGRDRARRMIPAQVGPAIRTGRERLLLEHPEHAHMNLPAGDYLCLYQIDFGEQRAVRD